MTPKRTKTKNSSIVTVRFDSRELANLVHHYQEELGQGFPKTRGEFIQFLISIVHNALDHGGSLTRKFPTYGEARDYLDSVDYESDNKRAREMMARRLGEEVSNEITNLVPEEKRDDVDNLFDNLMGGKKGRT